MPKTSNNPSEATARILPPNAAFVKARIISAGLKLGDLAAAAGVSQSSLSNYLIGRVANYRTQQKIFKSFRKVTGINISFNDFWGPLAAAERIAG